MIGGEAGGGESHDEMLDTGSDLNVYQHYLEG